MPIIPRHIAAHRILTAHGLGRKRYSTPAEAMRALVAVQTQYPASLGPALAARANGVTDKWVQNALLKEKTFLKAWNLRATLHTMLPEDHMLLLAALQRGFYERYRKWSKATYELTDKQLDDLHDQLLNALQSGPIGRKELHERVPFYKGKEWTGWGLDLKGLSFEGKVVLTHQAASGTEFARLDLWAPHLSPYEKNETEALAELMRRYFATYGPATFSDFMNWTQTSVARAKKAWNIVLLELQEVHIKDTKGPHYVFGKTEWRNTKKSSLRLLPKFDPLVMGHKDKTWFMPAHLKGEVFRKAGQVEATVLADLQLRGTWRTVRKGNTLEFLIYPFEEFKKEWIDQLPREAARTALSLGFKASTFKLAS